jgi:hypothetical protein
MSRSRCSVVGCIVVFRKYAVTIIGAEDDDSIDGEERHVRRHVQDNSEAAEGSRVV